MISRSQLIRCGLSSTMTARWVATGRLHRVHPGVYALGHRRIGIEGRLAAALLYAGPGAALCHATAAWWWRLIDREPTRIEVSAPGRRRSIPTVRVHHPRRHQRTMHRGFPVTAVPQTLLDHAATATPERLRRALAEADYRGLLELEALDVLLGRGHRGSAKLRAALVGHRPDLALTRSVLEERFLALCESEGIAPPEVNATICGLMVDALWRAEGVIVELDGSAAHRTPAQLGRDHQRDLRLRAAGYTVLRYSWQQITRHTEQVSADLRAARQP